MRVAGGALFVLLLAPLALTGCNSIGAGVGAVAGIATGAGTANPIVGAAVSIGTQASVDALVKYLSRRRQQGEQDAIVTAAGSLPPGGTAAWRIDHTIPIGNAHGTMLVVRDIPNPLAACKEVVFTVEDDAHARYVTSACQQAGGWKWAQAEPATGRWGSLQ